MAGRLVTAALLAATVAILLFGKTAARPSADRRVRGVAEGLRGSPWGLVAAVAVFTAAAYIGAPQFVLIAACVVAFGPWVGFLYSWIATVVSAAATYWTGRCAPAPPRWSGWAARRPSRVFSHVGNNAFTASFVIRNVPSAPFILVNMAFGAARASFPPSSPAARSASCPRPRWSPPSAPPSPRSAGGRVGRGAGARRARASPGFCSCSRRGASCAANSRRHLETRHDTQALLRAGDLRPGPAHLLRGGGRGRRLRPRRSSGRRASPA